MSRFRVLAATALLPCGCGCASSRAIDSGNGRSKPAASVGLVRPASGGDIAGYGPAGPGHATPYPLARAASTAHSGVLAVTDRHALPPGAQGIAWVLVRASAPGTSRLSVFGGCSLPYPLPSEPPGVGLVCDTVGHAFAVPVVVVP